MNKLFCQFLFFCLLLTNFLYSDDISRECYDRVPQQFFSRNVVIRSLELYQVHQSQWAPIVDDLNQQSLKIPAIVRSQARSLLKDPYTPPVQPDVIKDLFLKELEKVFNNVMHTHNAQYSLIDDAKIHQMFVYILQNNGAVFDSCIKRQNIYTR